MLRVCYKWSMIEEIRGEFIFVYNVNEFVFLDVSFILG